MSKVDEIMVQAQVFASAWSLVSGLFDNGQMLTEAEEAKAELRQMIEALAQPAGEAEPTEGDLLDAFNRGESVADGLAEVAALFTTAGATKVGSCEIIVHNAKRLRYDMC